LCLINISHLILNQLNVVSLQHVTLSAVNLGVSITYFSFHCLNHVLYCLPILTHVAAAVSFKVRQLAELNACWNSVYRKIFGFNRWESVKVFIQGLGRLDLTYIYMLRKCKWLCSNRRCANPVFNNLLWVSLSECNDVNKFTMFMFMSQHEIRQHEFESFASYYLN